ncbi:MAG: transketolase family protein [Anaerolineae bacterium]|nr:transketolase family protein [Anaerolineae bacterium]
MEDAGYYPQGKHVAIRYAFGEAFLEVAKRNPKVVVVTADLGGSVNLKKFWDAYPERYFNCGVAEADMIGVSAGLAIMGYIPFAVTFGSFLGRAMDHIRQSVGHNKVNVKIVGSHGGVSNAQDGPSAHALEDLAMIRAIPNIAVVVVADANQVLKAASAAADYPAPVYLRLYREPLPVFTDLQTPFTIGKANVMRQGSDVTVIACGPHVGFCLQWAEELASESSIEVIDCHTLRPLDTETLLASARKTRAVVTVEDHNINGGLGSAVAEMLVENDPIRMKRVGLTGFATSGKYIELINAVGIGKEGVRRAIHQVLEEAEHT